MTSKISYFFDTDVAFSGVDSAMIKRSTNQIPKSAKINLSSAELGPDLIQLVLFSTNCTVK